MERTFLHYRANLKDYYHPLRPTVPTNNLAKFDGRAIFLRSAIKSIMAYSISLGIVWNAFETRTYLEQIEKNVVWSCRYACEAGGTPSYLWPGTTNYVDLRMQMDSRP